MIDQKKQIELIEHLRREVTPEVAEEAKGGLTTVRRESLERIREESTLITAEVKESRGVETSLLERTEAVEKDRKGLE